MKFICPLLSNLILTVTLIAIPMAADATTPLRLISNASAQPHTALTKQLLVEPGVIRIRSATLDPTVVNEILGTLTQHSTDSVNLQLDLFNDVSLPVMLTSSNPVGNGYTAYYGQVMNSPESSVAFVSKNGSLTGSVQTLGNHYQLRFRNNNEHEIVEIDQALLRDHDDIPSLIDKKHSARPGVTVAADKNLIASGDDGSIIDVMVAYTATARAGAGGTSAIESQIAMAIAQTNQAYQRSGVIQRLNLVHTREVNYTEAGDGEIDLSRLRGTSDGYMDEIHAYRDAYGADIVSLWVENAVTVCGVGYLMSTVSTAFAPAAFNVVDRHCATSTYTFPHELGHNMGLRHDTYVDSSTTPYPYAHGYVDLVNRFRTIMSYNDNCTAQGFSCSRLLNFSNPNIFNNGSTTGLTATADAARVLNNTRTTTANFRQTANLSSGGLVTFIKTAYVVNEGAGTVQLTVYRMAGTSSDASVTFSTTNGTALAGADFTATSGTLTWAAGDETPRTITIPITQDTLTEGSETFSVTLSNPVGATLGNSPTATVEILDDEPGVFPPNCALPVGWNNAVAGATNGWQVATDSSSEGRCSLKSGLLADAPQGRIIKSQIAYTGSFLAGNITFSRRVSSESGYDCFRFLIDGTQQNIGGSCLDSGGIGASGEIPWGPVSIPVTTGTHTLIWSYEKDEGASDGADATWIDNVSLPLGNSLTITKAGTGTGTVTSSTPGINCGSDCNEIYPPGTMVTLVATAASGSNFTGWAGACTGVGTCQVAMDSAKNVTATFDLPSRIDYSDLWWAGNSENGWGMSITQHSQSGLQFNALYVYEADGSPTWYVMPGGTWNSDFTVYSGALYRPSGSIFSQYNKNQLVVGASVGNATITYTSATTATVQYTINGIAGQKNISRQPFGTVDNTAGLSVKDLWWAGAAEDGWGISIAQQYRTLFAVWYTYCPNGKACWFVMPGGVWNSNTYVGTLYTTTSSSWLGASYNPAALSVTAVGTLTLTFIDANNATMNYQFTAGPYAGTNQTKTITRQPF